MNAALSQSLQLLDGREDGIKLMLSVLCDMVLTAAIGMQTLTHPDKRSIHAARTEIMRVLITMVDRPGFAMMVGKAIEEMTEKEKEYGTGPK